MELRPVFMLVCLLAAAVAVAQEAYRWVDEDGVVHYSDRPREGAEAIVLPAPNVATTRPVQRPSAAPDEDDEPAEESQTGYTSIEIVSPGAEETLWNIEGVLNVSVALQPGLQPGHQVRAYFDGQMQPVSGTSFQLQEVWRGVHNIRDQAKNILDGLSSGVILLDRNLLILGLNPAAENILGISQRRARGESLLRLLDDDPELRDILSRVSVTGDHYANELRLGPNEVEADERIVDCRVSPIDSGPATLLVELTDVTRRSKISRENALLIQHGAGRQMIRQLAHEIKNPLGGIRGSAQLLARQLDNEELTEYTDVVISETDRLASLVDTLLGPGGAPNKQPLNVHELIEYVVRIIEAEDRRSLHIVRDYDPGLPLIELDRDQMVQAFLNLMRNAAAALDGQGTITLRSRAVTNFTIGETRHRVIASIEIQDDGPGIPADLQDTVFYPLVTSNPNGTGLGLPAAQELLSRHGGLIEFESRPGRTVFFVRIPLEQKRSPL